MAKKKKKPLGFETPSMQIQEEYGEILKQIKKKETNWGKVLKGSEEACDVALAGAEAFAKRIEPKETHGNLMELEHRVMAVFLSTIQLMIAKVGKELAECDIRIAAVEKELKELRRGQK